MPSAQHDRMLVDVRVDELPERVPTRFTWVVVRSRKHHVREQTTHPPGHPAVGQHLLVEDADVRPHAFSHLEVARAVQPEIPTREHERPRRERREQRGAIIVHRPVAALVVRRPVEPSLNEDERDGEARRCEPRQSTDPLRQIRGRPGHRRAGSVAARTASRSRRRAAGRAGDWPSSERTTRKAAAAKRERHGHRTPSSVHPAGHQSPRREEDTYADQLTPGVRRVDRELTHGIELHRVRRTCQLECAVVAPQDLRGRIHSMSIGRPTGPSTVGRAGGTDTGATRRRTTPQGPPRVPVNATRVGCARGWRRDRFRQRPAMCDDATPPGRRPRRAGRRPRPVPRSPRPHGAEHDRCDKQVVEGKHLRARRIGPHCRREREQTRTGDGCCRSARQPADRQAHKKDCPRVGRSREQIHPPRDTADRQHREQVSNQHVERIAGRVRGRERLRGDDEFSRITAGHARMECHRVNDEGGKRDKRR